MIEQPIETTIKELLERGSSYKFTEGQIGMVLELIKEDKKRAIKNRDNQYSRILPLIFENLYHQEDEGDFTPMAAYIKLNDELKELEK